MERFKNSDDSGIERKLRPEDMAKGLARRWMVAGELVEFSECSGVQATLPPEFYIDFLLALHTAAISIVTSTVLDWRQ